MKKHIPFLIFINCLFVGIPVTALSCFFMATNFGAISAVITGIVLFNSCLLGANWAMDLKKQ